MQKKSLANRVISVVLSIVMVLGTMSVLASVSFAQTAPVKQGGIWNYASGMTLNSAKTSFSGSAVNTCWMGAGDMEFTFMQTEDSQQFSYSTALYMQKQNQSASVVLDSVATAQNDSDYAAFVDWASNPISNGGNMPNLWRTLSKDEWGYLIKKRTNAKSRYGVAAVNGISGLVILPDDWTLPAGCDFTSGSKSVNVWTGSSKNNYTSEQWAAMEEAGAVFLPASGCRNGITVENIGTAGSYWSSSSMMGNGAYALYLYMGILYPQYLSHRNIGSAVRLVTDIKVDQ